MSEKLNLADTDAAIQLVELIDTGIYWTNKMNQIVGSNRHFLSMFGLESNAFIAGLDDLDFWDAEQIGVGSANRHCALSEQHTFERYKTLAGGKQRFLINQRTLRNRRGESIGAVCTCQNISHSEQVWGKLSRTESVREIYLDQALNRLQASVYLKDIDGRILDCNKYLLDMFACQNKGDIFGKNEYDLLPADDAKTVTQVDQQVLQSGFFKGEEIISTSDGGKRVFSVAKNLLRDRKNNVIGIVGTSLDITAQKEADSLLKENEQHQIIESKNQQFRTIANQVAHDIASPLAALSMIIPSLPDIPESLRITLNQAVSRIEDISGELLRQFRSKDTSAGKEPVRMFAAMELMGVLSEKRSQYSKSPVKFTESIADNAWFAAVSVNRSDWQRMLSNLINNSVDSFSGRSGEVRLELSVVDAEVVMVVSDNGKGMSDLLCKTIARCIPVTEDKADGHGIGLSQFAGVLQRNQGRLEIESSLGDGTSMIVSLPLVEQPDWAATELNLDSDQLVLVLDDDEFIHGAWDSRFQSILQTNSAMQLIHFTKAEELLIFLALLSDADLPRIYLLSDYELLNQDMNGLDIIEQRHISRATLVTSHYGNASVIDRAKKLNIQVLPKRLAPKIPIALN